MLSDCRQQTAVAGDTLPLGSEHDIVISAFLYHLFRFGVEYVPVKQEPEHQIALERN
jgi:hypothetical protein